MNRSSSRQESDFLGTRSIPAAAYWGVHTARAALGVMSAADVQALLVPEKLTRPLRLEE